jgi:Photosynthetic reaction centre cytochrome C subunit
MRIIQYMNKKMLAAVGIGLFIALGIAATHAPSELRNLKVIPKNIDEAQVERIMHKMSHDLGVTCSHCHPNTKPGIFPQRVDFISDEIPAKKIARKMMVMTDKLNKKYFNYINRYDYDALINKSIITCNTCHRGLEKPNNNLVIPD